MTRTATIPVFVTCYEWDMREDGFPHEAATLHIYSHKPQPYEHHIFIGEGVAEITLTKANVLAQQVATIDAQIEETKEQYHQKLAELKEKKQNLLAIAHDPAPPRPAPNFEDDLPF